MIAIMLFVYVIPYLTQIYKLETPTQHSVGQTVPTKHLYSFFSHFLLHGSRGRVELLFMLAHHTISTVLLMMCWPQAPLQHISIKDKIICLVMLF